MDEKERDRLGALERARDDHARRIGELESSQRRAKSDIEKSVGDMMSAAIKHIEKLTDEHAKKFEQIAEVGESTLALNKSQSAMLEDVKGELEKSRIADAARDLAREIERKRARADVAAEKATRAAEKYAADLKLKRIAKYTALLTAFAGVLSLLGYLAVLAQRPRELPEKPELHQEKEK